MKDFMKINLYEDGSILIKNIIFLKGKIKSYIYFDLIQL